jgi:ligand-binding sensor domain-containing protein
MWIASWQGGVVFYKDGEVRAAYWPADGMGTGRVNDLYLDREGAVWVATEGGLSRIKDGRVSNLTSKNGLPCDAVHGLIQDDTKSFWLYMGCGLVRVQPSELDASFLNHERRIRTKLFDLLDGVKSRAGTFIFAPRMATGRDGKVWFVPFGGGAVMSTLVTFRRTRFRRRYMLKRSQRTARLMIQPSRMSLCAYLLKSATSR